MGGASVIARRSRVDQRVDDVDAKVQQDEEDRHGKDETLDGRVVGDDQRFDRKGANAWPGENLLHQHIGAEGKGEDHAKRCDDRQHRVPEGVLANDRPPTEAGRSRCPDEIAAQRLQHRAARHARDGSQGEEHQRDHRQQQLAESGRRCLRVARDQRVDNIEPRDVVRRQIGIVQPADGRRRPTEQIVEYEELCSCQHLRSSKPNKILSRTYTGEHLKITRLK